MYGRLLRHDRYALHTGRTWVEQLQKTEGESQEPVEQNACGSITSVVHLTEKHGLQRASNESALVPDFSRGIIALPI